MPPKGDHSDQRQGVEAIDSMDMVPRVEASEPGLFRRWWISLVAKFQEHPELGDTARVTVNAALRAPGEKLLEQQRKNEILEAQKLVLEAEARQSKSNTNTTDLLAYARLQKLEAEAAREWAQAAYEAARAARELAEAADVIGRVKRDSNAATLTSELRAATEALVKAGHMITIGNGVSPEITIRRLPPEDDVD